MEIELIKKIYELDPHVAVIRQNGGVLSITPSMPYDTPFTLTKKDVDIWILQKDDKIFEFSSYELVALLCHFKKTRHKYGEQYTNWKRLESDGFEYLVPLVTVSDLRQTLDLFKYVSEIMTDDAERFNGRVTFLFGEYGLGKTSFCRYYAHKSDEQKFPFVFVFYLSEFKSGSIVAFIETKLATEYRLNMKYDDFVSFCKAGLFAVILDAYDQTYDRQNAQQIQTDYLSLMRLREDKGRVLITTRNSYYRRILKPIIESSNHTSDHELTYLAGFNFGQIERYLNDRHRGYLIDDIRDHWKHNERILTKPLNLQLYIENVSSLNNPEHLTEYCLLSCSYEKWVKELGNNVKYKLFLRALTRTAWIFGRGRKIERDILKNLAKDVGIDEQMAVEALKRLVYFQVEETYVEFKIAAYLEYLCATFVLEEIDAPCTIKDKFNEKVNNSFLRQVHLNIETLNILCNELKANKDERLASNLGDLILYTRDAQNFEQYRYLGGNCLSLLCYLCTESVFKKIFDAIKDGPRSFQSLNLAYADCSNMNLDGVDFSYSNMQNSDLSYTSLRNTVFHRTDLTDVRLHEHECMLTGAFVGSDQKMVAAGTKAGGILYYCLENSDKKVFKAHEAEISAISAEGVFVYSASLDGYASRISDNFADKHDIYISRQGVQSIVSINEDVFVGTRAAELYLWDWANAEKNRIPLNIEGPNFPWVMHLQAFSFDGMAYLIVVLANNKIIIKNLVNDASDMSFDAYACIKSICVTEYDLLFVTSENMVKKISLQQLRRGMTLRSEPFHVERNATITGIAFATETQCLYLMMQQGNRYILKARNMSMHNADFIEVMSMVCDKPMQTFAVSLNGSYVALAGEQLIIAKKNKCDHYFEHIETIIDAEIDCTNAQISQCKVSTKTEDFFEKRGAKINKKADQK